MRRDEDPGTCVLCVTTHYAFHADNELLSQRHVRKHVARKRFLSIYCSFQAARVLQRHFRGFVARSWLRSVLNARKAAATIQHAWRMYSRRLSDQAAAATLIQCVWRSFWAQVQYYMHVMDIIAVQSCVRRRLAVCEKVRLRKAREVLRHSARIYLHEKISRRVCATLKIQVSNARFL
jgi:hypothetical protein